MKSLKVITIVMISMHFCVFAASTQRPNSNIESESSPFLDMASSFLENLSQGQAGGNSGGLDGIAGIASIVGNLMQANDGGKSSQSGSGTAQILAGLGSLLAANSGNGGNSGFDPSIIGNVIQMFAAANSGGGDQRSKRSNEGSGMETILSLASTFLSNYNNQETDETETNEINYKGEKSNPYKRDEPQHPGDNLLNLLPMVAQTLSSFMGADMEKTEAKHKDHSGILPPFLEKIHTAWDLFANSELSDAIYKKIGLDNVFKGFLGVDGKVDYDRLFESLQNQSFRKRWIQKAVVYLAEWANYLANPEVYRSYFATGQMMLNGFLQSQGFPKNTHFDITKPSETLSNLIDHAVKKHLNIHVKSMPYVKPVVSYIKDVSKLGKNREYLQKMNTTEVSNKLTDTLNLEIIEPILKIHRAYRYATTIDQECDRYVLCEINSHDPNEKLGLGLGGFKSGVLKFGSYAASWFISEKTQTPFWTLFASVNDPYRCQQKYPIDCQRFNEGEQQVTTKYAHTEL
ncbi:hypothetical protein PVAND_003788 [Polypedilum vanderplanki]|uniref:Uncharacterized protein n=1 Tax=Polypedilum vanderplanki TaxID=319348 RepID=A0A9J6BVM6_POLVA|nr:hypothetical protein PVAND_003788 [Polypedilum vanderplanki]